VGATVNILGTNLTGATSVSFNGTAATFKVVSASLITATVPAGATSGVVTVTTLSGTLTSNVPFVITPTYTALPTFLAFGSQTVGTSSAAQLVRVTNTGAVALPITGITLAGANPAQFSKTTTCGTSVAIGTSCTISVVFKPTVKGSKTATLNVNAGGGAGTQTVSLSGTGT
jgi:hypothetical protein